MPEPDDKDAGAGRNMPLSERTGWRMVRSLTDRLDAFVEEHGIYAVRRYLDAAFPECGACRWEATDHYCVREARHPGDHASGHACWPADA